MKYVYASKEEWVATISAAKLADRVREAEIPFGEKMNVVRRLIGGAKDAEFLKLASLLNEARQHNIVSDWAFTGGAAVNYYGAPISTEDADALVILPTSDGLIDLGPAYRFFVDRGATIDGIYLVISGWYFQFVPASTPLEKEALSAGRTDGEIRVVTPEHLIAMKLTVNRAKDKTHILHLLESASSKINRVKLDDLLQQYGLTEKFEKLLSL